jgi:hypothetical protein
MIMDMGTAGLFLEIRFLMEEEYLVSSPIFHVSPKKGTTVIVLTNNDGSNPQSVANYLSFLAVPKN